MWVKVGLVSFEGFDDSLPSLGVGDVRDGNVFLRGEVVEGSKHEGGISSLFFLVELTYLGETVKNGVEVGDPLQKEDEVGCSSIEIGGDCFLFFPLFIDPGEFDEDVGSIGG